MAPLDRKSPLTGREKGMNQAREQSMKTFEELYAEPPPYTPASTSTGGSVPKTEDLNFQPSPLEIPTPAECIAHLKLLHAFAKMRRDVGNCVGLYGIGEVDEVDGADGADGTGVLNGESSSGGVHEQDVARGEGQASNGGTAAGAGLAERLRDKRWAVFVAKAVDRYEKWWAKHSCNSSEYHGRIKKRDFEPGMFARLDETPRILKFPTEGSGYETSPEFRLPPLDVLMVWHAHMLNPRIYLEDCIRYTNHRQWRTIFPWQVIYDSIDNETFEYTREDTFTFKRSTGHDWDPLQDQGLKKIRCPKCAASLAVSWTQPPPVSSREALEAYLVFDTGFAGSELRHDCPSCHLTITHEKLRVGKFCNDADALIDWDRPLAGTILNMWGEPAGTSKGKTLGTHDAFFPNRAVDNLSNMQSPYLRPQLSDLTVDSIKRLFRTVLTSRPSIAIVNAQQKRPEFVAKMSRIAVRKVLSHYWDNSSIHGIDLIGAVLRQGTFVQKMVKLDWLRSPGHMRTAQRCIVKYHRFVRLAADNSGRMVVPTLDVDLAWHTHQLTPSLYYRYTLAETGKFMNHDDKVPESNLHTAFQWTSRAYEKKYGQPYSECSCWYCECTREPLRSSFLGKLSSRRASLSIEKMDEKGFTKDAFTGPHLSAHNALPTPTSTRQHLQDLDLQYAKVLKRYQRDKKASQPPRKDTQDPYYGAYGYPMMYPMPMYMPYAADPGVCEHTNSASAGGACASGTCCDAASMGACAGGEGTPGCAASCGGHGDAGGGCGTCGGGGDGGGGGGDGGGGGCGGGGE